MTKFDNAEIVKSVARRMSLRRRILGISQEELATDCRFTLEKYRKLERAEEPILPSELKLIAKTLGVPIFYFYWEKGISLTQH